MCGNAARKDLCGGQGVTPVPTATDKGYIELIANKPLESPTHITTSDPPLKEGGTASAFQGEGWGGDGLNPDCPLEKFREQ